MDGLDGDPPHFAPIRFNGLVGFGATMGFKILTRIEFDVRLGFSCA